MRSPLPIQCEPEELSPRAALHRRHRLHDRGSGQAMADHGVALPAVILRNSSATSKTCAEPTAQARANAAFRELVQPRGHDALQARVPKVRPVEKVFSRFLLERP